MTVTKKHKSKMEKRKNKTNKRFLPKNFWFGAFVILILITSVFGIINMNEGQNRRIKYNDYTFTLGSNNIFTTKINGINTEFYYFPKDLDNIEVSTKINNLLKNAEFIDLTSDIEDDYKAEIAITQLLFKETIEKHKKASIDIGFLYPTINQNKVYTCNDATEFSPVIVYYTGEQNSIYEQDNCIIIEAENSNYYYILTTRLLYSYFGIMD
jgi:hypothetical protein